MTDKAGQGRRGSRGPRGITLAGAVLILLGVQAVAVAGWLIPASVHIVEWTAEGPHRVALFASQRLLVGLAAAGLVAGAALALFAGRKGSRRAVEASGWLCLLWLWVVPFLPWLPDRFPLLLLFAGPLRWVVAAVSAAGIVSVACGSHLSRIRGSHISRMCGSHLQVALRKVRLKADPTQADATNQRTVRRAVFVASLAVYLVFGALHARSVGPGGDEPHYLVVSHSLLTDGDLLIENNHAERDYLPFFGGNLRPDYMRRGQDGQIYSIHAPGLPILLLPAYAAGGYGAVVALLCLIAALTALAIFDLAYAIAGHRAALVTWAAVCLTVPFIPHSWMIFPELPGALVVAWAALWVWRGADQPIRAWIWRGAALAALPWLHTKFIIFTGIFAAALLVKIWKGDGEPKRLALRRSIAFTAPIALSIAVWLYSFYVIYGTIDPEAPYGDYPKMFVLMRNIPRGLLGLFFDQKFGLLVYAPVYVFAIGGCWFMLRRAQWRWLAGVLLLTTAAHVGSTTRLYMWWGGSSAPARFLVPILPCLAPMMALAVAHFRSATDRALLWLTFPVSVGVAIAAVVQPERLLLFSDSRGRGRIVELVQGPSPLVYLLPTFTFENWRAPLLELVPWMLAAAITVGAAVAVQRIRPVASMLRFATAVALMFVFSAGVLAASVPRDARADAARRGAMDLMWRYDAQRLRPLSYRGLRRIDQNDVLALSTVVVERAPEARDPNQRVVAGPFTLPPGSYEARVWFEDARPRDGEIVVSISDRAVFGRSRDLAANPAIVPFQLPVGVGRITVSASPGPIAGAAAKVEIAPAAIVPPSERARETVRAIESIPDHPGAFIVYVNEHTYPEGGVFWTRGTGAGAVLVAPGGARRMTLTLFSGPLEGDVTVTIAGSEQRVRIPRGEPAQFPFLIPPGMRLVRIAVQSAAFFRPSEVDPASTDSRGLGCQVRISLE